MAGEDVIGVPFGEMRGLSTAGGGTAISTGVALIPFLERMDYVTFIPRNFSTAVVVKVQFNPWLSIIKTTDALATDALSAEFGMAMQDADSSTTMSLNSFGAGTPSFIYIGSHIQFRGVRVVIGNTNSNVSALTVKYWNTSNAWASISPTDGTDSGGGATFSQTGSVTWTVPTDWKKASLNSALNPANAGIGDTTLSRAFDIAPLYWTRWEVSVALDSSVTWTGALSLNRNTANYPEYLAGERFSERFAWGMGGYSCIEALTDAGTANLIVSGGTTGARSSLK